MTMPDAEDSAVDDKLMSDGGSNDNLDAYRISKRKSKDGHEAYQKVKLRGHTFDFSPRVMNSYYGISNSEITGYSLKLGDVIEELTGNIVKTWSVDGTQLATSILSLRYLILHKAALFCLVLGSNNTNVSHLMGKVLYVLRFDEQLNIGQVIFDQVIDHAKSHSTLKPIGFPSMICGILLAWKPDLLQLEDGVGVHVKPLMISEKLMKGKRVMDVPLNPQDAPEPEPILAPESEAATILIKMFEEEQ
ncbi:hypothetical protein LIER_40008 [Lithospermum erythrorhizon]|uniref:Putative plant transposon protein domain-containing protein n=1 Tax=Lithospermum erythrorhizon TaxID=34254 RepID=A0AAV3QSG0_LITER